jgi:MerR family transcriptional regulator, light-induced transcriptional regulator
MTPSGCEALDDGRASVEALADDAVEWVTSEIIARYADRSPISGAPGRSSTRQDVRDQASFLAAAVATPAVEAFRDYVQWLAAVTNSRGASVQTLGQSLALLKEFFEGRLEPDTLTPVVEMLDAGLDALAKESERSQPLYHAHLPAGLAQVEPLTQSLLRGDIATARSIALRAFAERGSYIVIATHLFQPALYRIGLLWQQNEITVAQEHLATAICQNVLSQLYARAVFAPPSGHRALFAAIAGNEHTMGLRMVSDAFELDGWSVQYLGANTPTDALVEQIDAWRPEVVGLSVSLVQQLTELKQAVGSIRERFGDESPTIIVGGIPINQISGIWRWTGADGWSTDASKAVSAVF